MCGRYSLTTPVDAMAQLFGFAERPNLAPRWNIAPTQSVAAVRLGADGARHLDLLRWGLVPSWAKAIGTTPLINARADTIAEKPSFRGAFRKRRCLMPADGFYEWRETPLPKQPFRISLPDRPCFAIAGLWERWESQGQTIESCALITADANPAIAHVHHRMPVILEPAQWNAWLDPATGVEILHGLLRPYVGAIAAQAIDRRVNAIANDDAGCWAPAPAEAPPAPEPKLTLRKAKDTGQGSLF
ncbi:MAG: SOS response-associated peptidase [Alphaproteobacteria bacterium]|nr:SOS response-associated peptidase [Alphaproteobacteria bacterium]